MSVNTTSLITRPYVYKALWAMLAVPCDYCSGTIANRFTELLQDFPSADHIFHWMRVQCKAGFVLICRRQSLAAAQTVRLLPLAGKMKDVLILRHVPSQHSGVVLMVKHLQMGSTAKVVTWNPPL